MVFGVLVLPNHTIPLDRIGWVRNMFNVWILFYYEILVINNIIKAGAELC